MIIKIGLLILWIIVALLEGTRDGFFYAYRMNSAKQDKYNMHWLFTFQRLVIMILIAWIYSRSFSLLDTGVFVFSLILLFSFFHNGQYYWTRNFLDKSIYPKKWFSNSTTSESMLEFSVVARVFLAFVGIIGIITSFTF